jgi:hypothetical protein
MTRQGNTNKKEQNHRQINQLKLLTMKCECLEICVSLGTAFTAETHLAEGHKLEEQANMLKLRML